MKKLLLSLLFLSAHYSTFCKIKLDFNFNTNKKNIQDTVYFEQDGIIVYQHENTYADFDCVTLPDEQLSLKLKVYTKQEDSTEKELFTPTLILLLGQEASVSISSTNNNEEENICFKCIATKE